MIVKVVEGEEVEVEMKDLRGSVGGRLKLEGRRRRKDERFRFNSLLFFFFP